LNSCFSLRFVAAGLSRGRRRKAAATSRLAAAFCRLLAGRDLSGLAFAIPLELVVIRFWFRWKIGGIKPPLHQSPITNPQSRF